MSYIDVEKPGANYRIIFGRHSKLTPASQIPQNCTGIFLEGPYMDWNEERANIKEFIANMQETEYTCQFSQLFEIALDKKIPLVAAEPEVIEFPYFADARKDIFYILSEKYRYGFIKGSFLRLVNGLEEKVMARIAEGAKEIRKNSYDYRMASRFVRRIPEYRSGVDEGIYPRNLLMAQRMEKFAEYQLNTEALSPNLALIVGAMHLGVEQALMMDQSTRLKELNCRSLGSSFNLERLGIINYLIYGFEDDQQIVDEDLMKLSKEYLV